MYTSLTADSAQSIPQSSELTFVPSGEGLVFNPPQRSFLWQEPVHREEFRFKAAVGLDGKVSRGRLSVYLGRLLIAEVHLVIRVDSMPKKKHLTLVSEDHAQRFRRIYASVSRKDLEIIAEFKRYSELLNDRFLTTQFDEHPASRDTQSLIRSADVFQLYWSNNALLSQELEQEWTYALSLNRPGFVCPLYWEEPFPTDSARSMPPPELLKLGFQKIPQSKKQQSSIAESMKMSDPTSKADNLGVIFLDSRNDSDDVSTVTFDVTYDRDAPKPGESCSDLGGDNSDGGNDTMILCNDSDDSSTVAFFDSIDLCDTQSPDSVEFSIEFELCVRKQEQEEESRTDCGVASSDEVDEYCSEPGSITLSIPKSEDVISIHKEQKKHTGEKGWFETPTLRSRQSNLKWAMLAILAILTAMLLIRILWYFM